MKLTKVMFVEIAAKVLALQTKDLKAVVEMAIKELGVRESQKNGGEAQP